MNNDNMNPAVSTTPSYAPVCGPTIQLTDVCYITPIVFPPNSLATSVDQWDVTSKEWRNSFHMIGPILRVGTTYTIPRMMDWNTMPMMTTTSQPPCPQITTQTTQTTTSPPTDTTHNQQMNNMDPKQGINSLPRMTTRKRPLIPQPLEPQDQRLVTM